MPRNKRNRRNVTTAEEGTAKDNAAVSEEHQSPVKDFQSEKHDNAPKQKKSNEEKVAKNKKTEETSGLFPPKRKDNGTRGDSIKLRANHFAFNFDQKRIIYHYDVKVIQDVGKEFKKKIINQMAEDFEGVFSKTFWVFDGVNNIYTSVQLKNNVQEFEVQFKQGSKLSIFNVEVKKVAEIKLKPLQDFLEGKKRTVDQAAIQALDVVLRHLLSQRFFTQGRLIFPETEPPVPLKKGTEMWHGFYQSLRPSQMKSLQLTLDVSNRAFYTSQSVLSLLCQLFNTNPNNMKIWNMTHDEVSKLYNHLKGLLVETTHLPEQRRKYSIYKITEDSAQNLKFLIENEDKKEELITVEKYFHDKYKALEYPNLPCIQVNPPNKNIFIPLEVLIIPKGQRYNRLDKIQTAIMIKASAVSADIREKKIKDIIMKIKFNHNDYMKAYGLSLDEKEIHVIGRILPPPAVKSKHDKIVPCEGTWNMRGKELFEPVPITTWIALIFVQKYQFKEQDFEHFLSSLLTTGKKLGTYMDQPVYIKYCRNMDDAEKAFDSVQSEKEDVQLILAILPEESEYYDKIKRFGDTIAGIPTQCILLKNAKKQDAATLNNIFLKINAKLGGRNTIVEFEKLSASIFEKPVIILGADVTHPTPYSQQPSISAVLGSLDRYAVKFKAKISVQDPKVEIIVQLKDIVKDLLNEFHKSLNKAIPTRIIYYRDGVGEGQFQKVLNEELKAIKNACQMFNFKCNPQITLIIVQKRHNTRFFCNDFKEAIGKSKNIPPGVVIDTDIVHPVENDFYLCSHQGIQGTSRPTHYHVLWDESNFSADELHQLTYEMCHTYVRCSRAVSIPTPTYYAHLAAFRAREHMKEIQKEFSRDEATRIDEKWLKKMQEAVEVHENLSNMYFA